MERFQFRFEIRTEQFRFLLLQLQDGRVVFVGNEIFIAVEQTKTVDRLFITEAILI